MTKPGGRRNLHPDAFTLIWEEVTTGEMKHGSNRKLIRHNVHLINPTSSKIANEHWVGVRAVLGAGKVAESVKNLKS